MRLCLQQNICRKKNRAVVLVVSEESGDISIAEKGKLTRFDYINKLRAKLERVLVRRYCYICSCTESMFFGKLGTTECGKHKKV